MKQFNSFKTFLFLAFFGSVAVANAQTAHPLSFGIVGTNTSTNFYADYVGTRFEVTSPAAIAGDKLYTEATVADGWTIITTVTAPLINIPIIMPPVGDTNACIGTLVAGSMAGKIAVIWRGSCEFGAKAYAAQQAGALAVVIVNNVPGAGPVGMGAGSMGAMVTIPTFMIGNNDGNAIAGAYGDGTNVVTMTITPWGLGNTNDMGFVPGGISLWHNYAIPASQIMGSSTAFPYRGIDGAFIANYGTADQTNVTLSSTVSFTPTGGSATTIHTGTPQLLELFPAADSIWAFYETPEYDMSSAITGTGTVTVNYTIGSDAVDQYPADNATSYSFYVTDSLYCKTRYDFANNRPYANLYEAPTMTATGGDVFIWGPVYYVANGGSSIQDVTWTMSSNTDTGHILNSISSSSVYVFQWVDGETTNIPGNVKDSFMQNGELNLVGVGIKNFSGDTNPADTSGGYFTVTIGDSNGVAAIVPLQANSYYLVAPELQNGFFMGCDGIINNYPRTYGRAHFNNFLEYYAAMWPGDRYSGLAPQVNFMGDVLSPTTFGGESLDVDSTIYSSQKGLTPAVSMTSNLHPNAVKNVQASIGSINLFPNPASDYVSVALNLNQQAKEVTYTIIDASAKVVSKEVHSNVQNETYTYNTSKLATGNYFMVITANGGEMFRKFTVLNK